MHTFLVAILSVLLGACIGWAAAHSTVSAECQRLGGFFIGERVFQCSERAVAEGEKK